MTMQYDISFVHALAPVCPFVCHKLMIHQNI